MLNWILDTSYLKIITHRRQSDFGANYFQVKASANEGARHTQKCKLSQQQWWDQKRNDFRKSGIAVSQKNGPSMINMFLLFCEFLLWQKSSWNYTVQCPKAQHTWSVLPEMVAFKDALTLDIRYLSSLGSSFVIEIKAHASTIGLERIC